MTNILTGKPAVHAFSLYIIALSLLALLGTGRAGEVSGHVIGGLGSGPAGEAVQGARVYAWPIDTPGPGRHIDVVTGSQGEFLLTNVRAGRNEIHAYAPEIGYPDNMGAVFQTAPVPIIRMKSDEKVKGIVVPLGPPPGTLSGEVIGEDTRRPLPLAMLALSWADLPFFWTRSSIMQDGSFTFHLPAHLLLIDVTCRGYRPWRSAPVTIPSGGLYRVVVVLAREPLPVSRTQ